MKAGEIPHLNTRYYEVPPDQKTAPECESHGADHAAYKWIRQVDPRWSQEQVDAYLRGYEGTK